MANPPPVPKTNSTLARDAGPYGTIASRQPADTPRCSLFGSDSTATSNSASRSSYFSGTAVKQLGTGSHSSASIWSRMCLGKGGFGSTQSVTASTTVNTSTLGLSEIVFNSMSNPINSNGAVVSGGVFAANTPDSGSALLVGSGIPNPIGPTLSDQTPKSIRISRKQAMKLGVSIIMINVGQGEQKRSFAVYEALITARSKFFENAMCGDWKEAQTKVVNLPEDSPTAFALYEQLLYSSRISRRVESLDAHDIDEEFTILSLLYVLSEKLQDVDAKRVTADALLDLCAEKGKDGKRVMPGPKHIDIIYGGTPGPCAVRRLMVQVYAWVGTGDSLAKEQGTFPSDFVLDLAIRLLHKR